MLTSADSGFYGGGVQVVSPVELGFVFGSASGAECEMLTQYYRALALSFERFAVSTSNGSFVRSDSDSDSRSNDSGVFLRTAENSVAEPIASDENKSLVEEKLSSANLSSSVRVRDGNCYLRMILPKWRLEVHSYLGDFPTLARLQSVAPYKFLSRAILEKIKLFRDTSGVICVSDVGDTSAWDVLYFGGYVSSGHKFAIDDVIGGVAVRERAVAKSVETDGYCYLELIEDDKRQQVKDQLGAYPTLSAMLTLPFAFYSKRQIWQCGILSTGAGGCHVVATEKWDVRALNVLTAVAHAVTGVFPSLSAGDMFRKRAFIAMSGDISVFAECGALHDPDYQSCKAKHGLFVAGFAATMLASARFPQDAAIMTMVNVVGSDEGSTTVLQRSKVCFDNGYNWYNAALIDFGPGTNVSGRVIDAVFQKPVDCVTWAVCIPAFLPWCEFTNGQIVHGGRMIVSLNQSDVVRLRMNLGKHTALNVVIMWSDKKETTWGFNSLKSLRTVRLGSVAHL